MSLYIYIHTYICIVENASFYSVAALRLQNKYILGVYLSALLISLYKMYFFKYSWTITTDVLEEAHRVPCDPLQSSPTSLK